MTAPQDATSARRSVLAALRDGPATTTRLQAVTGLSVAQIHQAVCRLDKEQPDVHIVNTTRPPDEARYELRERNRTCAYPGCITVLQSRNRDNLCWVHWHRVYGTSERLTYGEVAGLFGCSRRQVERMVQRGHLVPASRGRFDADDIRALLGVGA